MKSDAIKKVIKHEYLSGNHRAIFIWGKPGVGKSQTIAQAAIELSEELGLDIDIIDLRLTNYDPTDLRGLQSLNINEGTSVALPPSILPKPDFKGILVLDELNLAAPMTQSAAYQLILDRKIGEYVLPDECLVIAAGNNQSDKGNTYRMAAPLANRFMHITYTEDIGVWKRDFAYPYEVHPHVIAFIETRNDMFHRFNPNSEEKNFPTPRSWGEVSNTMYLYPDSDQIEIRNELIAGSIGLSASIDFATFLSLLEKNIPSIDVLLNLKKDYSIPLDDISILYAVKASFIAYFKSLEQKPSDNDILALYRFIDMINRDEYQLAIFKDLLSNKISITSSRNNEIKTKYSNLVSKFSKLL